MYIFILTFITKVMEQVGNFGENSDMPMNTVYKFLQQHTLFMVAEDTIPYASDLEK